MSEEWDAIIARREIFWINLWQRSEAHSVMQIEGVSEVLSWSRDLVERYYPDGDAVFDGCQFVVNPVGSIAQPWHIDYSLDYTNIFIPMSGLVAQNATQYIALPSHGLEAAYRAIASNPDVIDLDLLAESCEYLTVCQLLAPAFSILRMGFGTIHRGVSNAGHADRVMFSISIKRGEDFLPVEPAVCAISNCPAP